MDTREQRGLVIADNCQIDQTGQFWMVPSQSDNGKYMVKAKFGDSVRSKTDVAMVNEVLAKLVCHNICCLIQSFYELGIDPFNGQKCQLPINAPRLASL